MQDTVTLDVFTVASGESLMCMTLSEVATEFVEVESAALSVSIMVERIISLFLVMTNDTTFFSYCPDSLEILFFRSALEF